MQRIKIITPDPIVETLLTLLTERLPEPEENTLLLDAVWMERMEKFPGIRIILFTASADPAYLTMARESGAAVFWHLRPSAEALLQVLQDEGSFPEATPVVRLGDAHSSDLTARELEVLREVVAGESDAAIAEMLHMSLRTVKGHIQSMRDKTGFRNRTELAVRARDCGLIINDKKT